MSLEDNVADAKVAVDTAERIAREKLTDWKAAQGPALAAFLREEARLTVVNQAEFTESIREQVPALKQVVTKSIDEATDVFASLADKLDPETVLAGGFDIEQSAQLDIYASTASFRKAFVSAGYSGGTRASNSEDAWLFYFPATGTMRSKRIPLAPSLQEFREAVQDLFAAKRSHAAAELKNRRANAEDLWGE